ncbi:MAG TPA: hypothetical protein VGG33_15820, partial [Polyangia bacterium]
VALGGCGITVKRDLSATQPGAVVYDDMCELQPYFDALHDTTIAPPREIEGQDLEMADGTTRATGGRARYRFETEFQLHHFRQLLAKNWGSLPEEVSKAPALELQVRWSEKASVKRVITTEPAVLGAGGKDYELPYHVCLSDILFGEDLYKTRRTVLNLPPPPPSRFSKKAKAPPVVAESAATTPMTTPAATEGQATPAVIPVGVEVPPSATAVPVNAVTPAAGAPTPSPAAPSAGPVAPAAAPQAP